MVYPPPLRLTSVLAYFRATVKVAAVFCELCQNSNTRFNRIFQIGSKSYFLIVWIAHSPTTSNRKVPGSIPGSVNSACE